ncbi:UDP-N-acetylglucosamine 2-epimerase (non-hydrolyzing) [Variovorax sp. CCNWLW225]|jgi:UDP-N-acetylglucosamine 2-epimerase|uniref:non-hydrolyzing UDP-N-acetylglucosamine 2-epimerase n=1 Tax=Variovorax sp. CCNWLW225 TaxID=3127462 RepID=UPI003078493E
MKRKVMTVIGTRPELIKMSAVIAKLDEAFEHVLVHTGQNYDYELNQIFFDDLGIRRPDHFLEAAADSPAATIAQVIARSDAIFDNERPEALLIYGDTNSGLCVIPAKRKKIPVFHMEAGNRCFDQRVPEELNRKVIDHLSDVNMVLTEHARRYLLAEGLPADRIFKVGSHLDEVLRLYANKIGRSTVLETLGLAPDAYLVVSLHREENVDAPEKLAQLVETVGALSRDHGLPVIVSAHPRTRARLETTGLQMGSAAVRLLPPFAYTDYVRLQQEAYCVISDSGTITEEAALLGLPAVSVRDAHERAEGVDGGTLVFSSASAERVLEAVRLVRLAYDPAYRRPCNVPDYLAPHASDTIVRIVASYIDIVNDTVWRKPRPS